MKKISVCLSSPDILTKSDDSILQLSCVENSGATPVQNHHFARLTQHGLRLRLWQARCFDDGMRGRITPQEFRSLHHRQKCRTDLDFLHTMHSLRQMTDYFQHNRIGS